jgi:hypothetical protein
MYFESTLLRNGLLAGIRQEQFLSLHPLAFPIDAFSFFRLSKVHPPDWSFGISTSEPSSFLKILTLAE